VSAPSMIVVMSFKPVYAYQILSGLKTCEVRYCAARFNPGDRIIVYASKPLQAFVGELTPGGVYCGVCYSDLEELAGKHNCAFPSDNWSFVAERYRGRRRLLLFTVKAARAFPKPVPLSAVQALLPGYKPPVSYARAPEKLYELLKALVE